MYDKLGAQLRTIDGVDGVNFAVWAPNATSVSVVGDFNAWDGRRHPMRKHIPSGFWELFVPGLGEGTLYKYRIRHHDHVFDKTDPMAFAAEVPPRTAASVVDLSRYHWHDQGWMGRRKQVNWLDQPLSFYEVHLGSWKRPGDDPGRWLSYRELAHQLVEYMKEMGYTHLELLPVAEHPFSGSWGYQTVGHFAAHEPVRVAARLHVFRGFVPPERHRHHLGLGARPFPRDGHGLRQFDGTALYEHADPRQGEHRDWGTMISTTAVTRFATSSSPTPCSGSTSTTSTASASTPWPRCCISTTAARRANGFRTNTADARTSRRLASSSSLTNRFTCSIPAR